MIFNQFEEMGNYMWHYNVTGNAISEAYEEMKQDGDRFAGAVFTSGSAGTMAAGDRLKEIYPYSKLGVGEALQCPTILENGFGAHRIEGIGDKHVPWIHNVKNTDFVFDIDDEDSQKILRLFNEPAGHAPLYDFTSEDDIRHTVWTIDDDSEIAFLQDYFSKVPSLYIADGHHRAASAVKVGIRRREANPSYTGEEEFNYFLAVLFPSEELEIMTLTH